MTAPFWKTKRLDEMSAAEWESLCDGCARCCLVKTRAPGSDVIGWTNIACELLDIHAARCSDYANRQARAPHCAKLTPANLAATAWVLPPSCAYRLVAEGKDLAWWHPLVSGDPDSVHRASVSVRGRAVPRDQAGPGWQHEVTWPGRVPRGLRASANRPSWQPKPPPQPVTGPDSPRLPILGEAAAAAPPASALPVPDPPASASEERHDPAGRTVTE